MNVISFPVMLPDVEDSSLEVEASVAKMIIRSEEEKRKDASVAITGASTTNEQDYSSHQAKQHNATPEYCKIKLSAKGKCHRGLLGVHKNGWTLLLEIKASYWSRLDSLLIDRGEKHRRSC